MNKKLKILLLITAFLNAPFAHAYNLIWKVSAKGNGQFTTIQAAIDQIMIDLDGTPNKSRLGGNALIATSMAVLQAAANARHLPLWKHLAGDAKVTLSEPVTGWKAGDMVILNRFATIARVPQRGEWCLAEGRAGWVCGVCGGGCHVFTGTRIG